MLATAQKGLVTLIKNSPLGKRLRIVDVLPVLATQQLFQKFITDAPGIFVDAGGFGDNDGGRKVKLEMALLLVAKNARNAQAAQQGDGIMIGLLEMADYAAALVDGATAGDVTWTVDRCVALDNFEDRVFSAHGLCAMSMKVCGHAQLLDPVDEQDLDSLLTVAVDFDVDPHASREVHEAWARDPKDTTGGTPDLQSTIQLEQ
jgi:hypothetical protein